ncbi:RodZ domain-containing protein [Pseudoalteromonas sp.]|uniref:RodZ domain-containing protein n=1 Tax=unclassified Pseudoalteromonas TaxID=194690 RepID=UPI003F9BC6A6
MNEDNTESTELTLGQTLKNSRENAGVSLEMLAKKLKLSVQKLQHLENDEYHLLGPATFIKGYVKSYCREFKLDTTAVLALFVEPAAPVTKGNMQSFSKRTEKEAHDSRLMLVSYAILALIIGSSALWWWQNSTPIADTVVNSTIQLIAEKPSESDTKNQAEPASPFENSEPVLSEPVVQSDPSANELIQANESQDAVTPSAVESSPITPTQASEGSSEIIMHFDEESWVEIYDGEGERIAFGVKKPGYVMTVTGLPPFSVVLGKHQVVDITLNGETVDLSAFPKNRLAKFNLPLVE